MEVQLIEEITLVMCECCYELILEDESKELSGFSYCLDCISERIS